MYLENRNLNKEMVEEGFAWNLDASDAALVQAEKEAKDGKKGLWAEANPVHPAEFRKGKSILTTGELVDPKTITVYLAQSGTKYHHKECQRSGAGKLLPCTLDVFKPGATKYGPCSYCGPPELTTPEGTEEPKNDKETK